MCNNNSSSLSSNQDNLQPVNCTNSSSSNQDYLQPSNNYRSAIVNSQRFDDANDLMRPVRRNSDNRVQNIEVNGTNCDCNIHDAVLSLGEETCQNISSHHYNILERTVDSEINQNVGTVYDDLNQNTEFPNHESVNICYSRGTNTEVNLNSQQSALFVIQSGGHDMKTTIIHWQLTQHK